MVIMRYIAPRGITYAPFYICTVRVPFSAMEQCFQKLAAEYPDYHQIPDTAGRLRWLRCQKGLYQEEAAAYVGINRTTYANYEETSRDYYPIDKMDKLARLYEVPVEDLMDDYNKFLLGGQGEQILQLRHSLGLTQTQFGNLLGAAKDTVIQWEKTRVKISKNTWKKIMRLAHS